MQLNFQFINTIQIETEISVLSCMVSWLHKTTQKGAKVAFILLLLLPNLHAMRFIDINFVYFEFCYFCTQFTVEIIWLLQTTV